MELKNFIKSAITQIVESVDELNNEIQIENVCVNPCSYNGEYRNSIRKGERDYNLSEIDFDLTVSVTENAETGAKVGVMASVIGLAGSKKDATENNSVSRLQFKIPVMLPSKDPIKNSR
ncbi:MAG: hypothetical protein ACRCY5_07035 [Phocaeicola sp.]